MKINFIVLYLCSVLLGCSNIGKLTYITKLPKNLGENSGMVTIVDSTIWLIEDHGNKDEIYKVDFKGNLLKDLKVKNAKNHDWEDLARDENGNTYIGDFGNNSNKRKDLVIYKIPNPEIEAGEKIDAEKIKFSYQDQKDFPPEVAELNYDAEAFFYKVPAVQGEHIAQLIGKFITCKKDVICQVTAADISDDGTKIALLGYGKLWIFTDFKWDDFSKGKMKTIDLGATTQLESICFLNNDTLLLSDEERGNTGGNLYSLKLK